jgi:hypothetical protein
VTASFDDDELEVDDDFRSRLLGDAAFNNTSSSELYVDTTVPPEHVGASSKRSPHSMVAGRTSPESSGTQ